MKEIIIEPLIKVGNITFGMPRSQVRELLGEYKEFKKSKLSSNTTDAFKECHVYYDSNNECEAIEFFGDVILKIGEDLIFPNEFDIICKLLKKRDTNIEIEMDSCTSIKDSIGVYAPGGKVQAILFGREGYYQF